MTTARALDLEACPSHAEVLIEAPRFTHVKRRDDGAVDFVSPLPCPFNYGSVPGTRSGDGERIDALVLGPRLPRGDRRRWPVVGVVRFVDAGAHDPKWVCSQRPLGARERLEIELFFRVYALCKRALNESRGRSGETAYLGLSSRA